MKREIITLTTRTEDDGIVTTIIRSVADGWETLRKDYTGLKQGSSQTAIENELADANIYHGIVVHSPDNVEMPDDPVIGTRFPVTDHDDITMMLLAPEFDPVGDLFRGGTRSAWQWFWLANGDLVCGFYPQSELFEDVSMAVRRDGDLADDDGSKVLLTCRRKDLA